MFNWRVFLLVMACSIGNAYGQELCRIVSVGSGKVLDVDFSTPQIGHSDGAHLLQWTSHGGPNQSWLLQPLPNGEYILKSWATGKVLDVIGSPSGEDKKDGTHIIQWYQHGGPNQRWRLIPAGNNEFFIQSVGSGKVLDVIGSPPGEDKKDGTHIIQWYQHGGPNQRWRIEKLALASPPASGHVGSGVSPDDALARAHKNQSELESFLTHYFAQGNRGKASIQDIQFDGTNIVVNVNLRHYHVWSSPFGDVTMYGVRQRFVHFGAIRAGAGLAFTPRGHRTARVGAFPSSVRSSRNDLCGE